MRRSGGGDGRRCSVMRLLLGGAAASSSRRTWNSVAQDVGGHQMVPATSLTDLHNVDAELAVLPRHRLELLCCPDPARIWSELVAEDVGHVRQLLLAAHRAVAL